MLMPCQECHAKSCQNQQSRNETVETDDEGSSREKELHQVRVVTRSIVKAENNTVIRKHDILLDVWEQETIRQLQLQDPDIVDIIIRLE